jgi:hypothetical protein
MRLETGMFWKRPSHISDEDLSAYVDGALGEGARVRVDEHAAACERCREALDQLLQLKASLAAMPRESAPRSFAVRQADLEDRPAAPASARGSPVLLGGLATVALVTFVTLVAVDVGGSIGGSGESDGDNSVAESGDQSFGDVAAEEPSSPGGGESAIADDGEDAVADDGDTRAGEPPAEPTDTGQDVTTQTEDDDDGTDVPLRAAQAGTAALALVAGGGLWYSRRRA